MIADDRTRPDEASGRFAYVVEGDGKAWATFSADRASRQRLDGDVVRRVDVDVAERTRVARLTMDPVAVVLMDHDAAGWPRELEVHVVLRDGVVVAAALDASRSLVREATSDPAHRLASIKVVPSRRVSEAPTAWIPSTGSASAPSSTGARSTRWSA